MSETRACHGGQTLPCRLRTDIPGQECESCGLRLPDKNVDNPHYGFVAWCPDARIASEKERACQEALMRKSGVDRSSGMGFPGEDGRIKCWKPERFQTNGVWEQEYGDIAKPVIVILDPQKVYENLFAKWQLPFEPHPARLAEVMRIREKGYFVLPDVKFTALHDELNVQQGRHRTTALAKLGFTAYPVVTTDSDAPLCLAKFGASIDEAKLRFDWSGIEYPVARSPERD